ECTDHCLGQQLTVIDLCARDFGFVLCFEFFVMLADEMGEHFGIGGRLKSVALELLFQSIVILDDPVVHHGNPAALVPMRVGVLVRRRSVGGPASVAEAHDAGHRFARQHRGKAFVDLSGALADRKRAIAKDSQPRAVIAAIFEPAQAIQQDRGSLLLAHVTNNSAHNNVIDEKATEAKGESGANDGMDWLNELNPLNELNKSPTAPAAPFHPPPSIL